MKSIRGVFAGVVLASILSAGCLTSGQFTVSADLPDPINAASAATIVPAQIDLNSEDIYTDHKDDLKGLVDCAILGEFTNTGGGPVNVTVWMTPGNTNHTTQAALDGDATKVLLWGAFSLPAGASNVKIGWDQSAGLFNAAGKKALIDEVKGDGSFSLYAVGQTAPYGVRLTKGVAVITIDAGK